MPYGLPEDLDTEENNLWMERCVAGVMKDGKEEEEAIAICKRQLMDGSSHAGASLQGSTREIIEIVTDPVAINAALGTSYVPGELCRFENMVLARDEVNANGDAISVENLRTLADTLPLMPIDDEHRPNQVVGVFTAARVQDNMLLTDGILYARRFPSLVDAVLRGEKRPSIEAVADTVLCRACGGEFTSEVDFCSHLKAKTVPKAYKNMRAVGGGIVSRPAGSTMFDLNRVYMVASYKGADTPGNSCDDEKLLVWYAAGDVGESVLEEQGADLIEAAKKKWSQDVNLDEGSLSELGWPSYEKIAEAIRSGKAAYATVIRKLVYLANITKEEETARQARDIARRLKEEFSPENETKAGINEPESTSLTEIEKIRAELDRSVKRLKELKDENDRLRDEVTARTAQSRKLMLSGVMSGDEFEANRDTILAMTDQQVELLLSVGKATGQPSSRGTMTVSFGDVGGVEVITL